MKSSSTSLLLYAALILGCSCANAGEGAVEGDRRGMVAADAALCAKLYEQIASPVCDAVARFSGVINDSKKTVIDLPDMSTGGTEARVFYIHDKPKIISVVGYGELGVQTDDYYVIDGKTIYVTVHMVYDNEKFKAEAEADSMEFVPTEPLFWSVVFTDGQLVKSYSEQAGNGDGHPAIPDDFVSGLLDEYKMVMSKISKKKG